MPGLAKITMQAIKDLVGPVQISRSVEDTAVFYCCSIHQFQDSFDSWVQLGLLAIIIRSSNNRVLDMD